jgi:protein gp37
MGDLYDPGFCEFQIEAVIEAARRVPQHLFISLTQRCKRAAPWHYRTPANWMHGYTARNQIEFVEGYRLLAEPARETGHRLFCSLEPLLEPICDDALLDLDLRRFAGLAIGSMSGPTAKPYVPDPDWGRQIIAWFSAVPRVQLYFKANWRKRLPGPWPMEKIPWPA